MQVSIKQKVMSVALAGALVLGGGAAIVGAQALAPQATGNIAYAKAQTGSDGEFKYQVASKAKVLKCVAKKKSTVEVAGKVAITADDNIGKGVAVTGIAAKAFKGTKAKTVKIYTSKLTKKGVKNCLKNSKVTKVAVPKKVLKKYKGFFTAKNCGKSVKVVVNADYSKAAENLAMPLE